MHVLRRQKQVIFRSRRNLKDIGMGERSATKSPNYTVLHKGEGYEERHYAENTWVSTKLQTYSIKTAAVGGFNKLLKYITGKNDKDVKIPMTVPVANRVQPGPGPNCESDFTVSFYLGDGIHTEHPTPADQDVYIDKWPQFDCYVKTFGGFTDDDRWVAAARELSEALPKDAPVHQDFYYTASYNSPFNVFNRTNEVWFVKKS